VCDWWERRVLTEWYYCVLIFIILLTRSVLHIHWDWASLLHYRPSFPLHFFFFLFSLHFVVIVPSLCKKISHFINVGRIRGGKHQGDLTRMRIEPTYKGMTSPSTQNLKVLDLWVFFLIYFAFSTLDNPSSYDLTVYTCNIESSFFPWLWSEISFSRTILLLLPSTFLTTLNV